MRAEREIDIVRVCLAWLRLQGVYCWRQNQGAVTATWKGRERFFRFTSVPGISDIIGLLRPRGQLLAVEIKQPGRTLRRQQRVFLEIVAARGGRALCVHSLDELRAALALPGPENPGSEPG